MADNDLLFNITAIDHYKAEMDSAYALVQRQVQLDQVALDMARRIEEAQAAAAAAGREKVGIDKESIAALTQQVIARQAANEKQQQAKDLVSVLTEEERKLLAVTTDQAQADRILAEATQRLNDAARGTGDSAKQGVQGFESLKGTIVAVQAGIGVAQTVLEGFKKAWDFTKEGAAIQRIKEQFDNMASSANVDSERLLSGLNKAAHGTVDDEALMQTATRAMALGIASNSDDLIKLMEVARASSVAFGGDTSAAFERISYAVENLAPRALKQSGIIIDLNKAYKDYADILHKNANELTDQEKRQALLNQTLEKGADLVKRIGDQGEDTATKIARFETKINDLGDSLKAGAADVFTPYLDKLTAIETATDKNATEGDKLRAAYEAMKSQGFDPASEAMQNFKMKIVEADEALAVNQRNALSSFQATAQGVDRLVQSFGPLIEDLKLIQTFKPLTDVLFPSKASDEGKATDISTLAPEKQLEATKAFQAHQDSLANIEAKGDAERVKVVDQTMADLAKLEADSGQKRADLSSKFASDESRLISDTQDKRISILMSYADTEAKITANQNQARIRLAQSYGVEVARAEEAYQVARERAGEDHARNLRKLADSRDALAIEDAQEAFQVDSRRAEEDYQRQARQKSEDYARQLAEQNAAAEEQRKQAKANEEKQLADLAAQFAKQDAQYRTSYQKQLDDLGRNTEAQRRAIWEGEEKKIADLKTAQTSERAAANEQWTQWRNEHEIFFAGEKALYDDYLKYTADQLKAYIAKGGATETTVPLPTNPVHGRASGGSVMPFGTYTVGERGPELLHLGAQSGAVTPNGGMTPVINLSINVAGTNASAQEIKSAVYAGIVEVFDKAMRQ